MPYVTQKERDVLDPFIQQLFNLCGQFRGRINYCITKLIHLWVLKQMEKVKSYTKKYDICNDAYGIMCSAVAEFYAAVVLPYEKLKREENGPVSQLDTVADGQKELKWKCTMCTRVFKNNEIDVGHHRSNGCPGCGARSNNWIQI